MINLNKALYNKFGIILKESDKMLFNYLVRQDSNINNVLKEFCDKSDTRYFSKNKINDIINCLINEEIGRDFHTPDGKGASGNITKDQILKNNNGIYVEESVYDDEEAFFLEDEEGNTLYKPMSVEQAHIEKDKIRIKNINK